MQAATFISVVGSICLVEVVANAAYGFMDNGYCHYKEYYQTSPAVTEANARVRELAEEEEKLRKAENKRKREQNSAKIAAENQKAADKAQEKAESERVGEQIAAENAQGEQAN